MKKTEYLAEKEYMKTHPEEYPYFVYYAFGFHNITYCTEDELKELVKVYRLTKIGEQWMRFGRQPITIMPRKEKTE